MFGLMSAGAKRLEGHEWMPFVAGRFWQPQLVALLRRPPRWWLSLLVCLQNLVQEIEVVLEVHVRQRPRSVPVGCSVLLLPSASAAFGDEQVLGQFQWAFSMLESEVFGWSWLRSSFE